MKITNLSTQELKIPMKKSSGHKLIVSLRPGQFVYSESEDKYANKQLIIWERKKAIEIIEEELPKTLEYCHPYSILPKNQIPNTKTKTIVLVEEDEDDDDDNVTSIPEVSVPEDVIDDSEDMIDDSEDDIDEKESEVSTNIDNSTIKKGGRPKGSKNKDKRGRKKTKKGRGRPSKNKTSVNDSNLNTDVI